MKINTKPDELSSLLAPEILDKLYSGRSMQLPKYLRTSHPFNSLNDSKFMHAEEMALSTSLQQAAFKGVDVHQASLQQNPWKSTMAGCCFTRVPFKWKIETQSKPNISSISVNKQLYKQIRSKNRTFTYPYLSCIIFHWNPPVSFWIAQRFQMLESLWFHQLELLLTTPKKYTGWKETTITND